MEDRQQNRYGVRRPSALDVSRRQSGLTLVELVVTLAIVSVLVGLAAPSFASMMRSTRLATSTNDFLSTLFLARSEAIKRGRRVTICTSADRSSCLHNIGWHRGWIVFEDGNGNGLREVDELILQVGAARAQGLRISAGSAGGPASPMRNYISYIPTGTTRSVTGALQMDTITFCMGGTGRQIVINAAGRPRLLVRVAC